MRAWEIPGTASSRYQLALRLLPKLGDGWLCRQQSKAGGRGLREAFNHPGPSVVQAVVDLTRIIHDSSSRNRAVAKRAVPDERPAPVHVNRESVSYWIHGLDLSDYPASHGWIPPTISRCRLNDAWKIFVWVLGGEIDEDHVIPLSNGPRVHIVVRALGN